jgi:hypothetical protein
MAAGILLGADLNLQAEARRKVRREEVRLRGVFMSRLTPRLGGKARPTRMDAGFCGVVSCVGGLIFARRFPFGDVGERGGNFAGV